MGVGTALGAKLNQLSSARPQHAQSYVHFLAASLIAINELAASHLHVMRRAFELSSLLQEKLLKWEDVNYPLF